MAWLPIKPIIMRFFWEGRGDVGLPDTYEEYQNKGKSLGYTLLTSTDPHHVSCSLVVLKNIILTSLRQRKKGLANEKMKAQHAS